MKPLNDTKDKPTNNDEKRTTKRKRLERGSFQRSEKVKGKTSRRYGTNSPERRESWIDKYYDN